MIEVKNTPETDDLANANPACAIMTKDCPPEADCRLQAETCRVADTPEGKASRYVYACRSCGAKWLVDFPMVQPVFDRRGEMIAGSQPSVTQFRLA